MSRNDLLLLVTGAIIATVIAGAPSPVARSSFTTASLIPSTTAAMPGTYPATFPPMIDQQ